MATSPDPLLSLDPSPSPDVHVHIIILTSSTLLPGSGSSRPPKPWYQLSNIFPRGMPPDSRYDPAQYHYPTMLVIRDTPSTAETWEIEVEHSKAFHGTLDLIDWHPDAASAGKSLRTWIAGHVKPPSEPLRTVNANYTYDTEQNLKACTYSLPSFQPSQEPRWFFWDVLWVKLESLKSYGIKDSVAEKERMDDMVERAKEGLEMVRRNRGDLTEREREEEVERRERLGVVEEGEADVQIIGAE